MGLAFVLVMEALTTGTNLLTGPERRPSGRNAWWLGTVLGVLLIGHLAAKYTTESVMEVHPIDTLMAAAKSAHSDWLKQASPSKSLEQAVDEYRRRYKRHPPP